MQAHEGIPRYVRHVVHGFTFSRDTNGHVLTVSERFIDELFGRRAAVQIRQLLAHPLVFDIDEDAPAAAQLPASFAAIAQEFVGSLPGRVTAIGAHLGLILAGARRLAAARQHDTSIVGAASADAEVFQGRHIADPLAVMRCVIRPARCSAPDAHQRLTRL